MPSRRLAVPSILILALAGLAAAAEPGPGARRPRLNPDSPATAYVGGRWHETGPDGAARFVEGDRYSIAGVFTADRPAKVDRTVDVRGLYLIPPLGEAHNHSVDGPATAPAAAKYLKQGVFSYKNPNDIARITAAGADRLNRPDRLDAAFAHGGLSVRGGHPEGLYRYLARYTGLDPEKLDGQAYFDVPTPAAVEARWPEILRGRPDFLKLYLLDAAGRGGASKPQGLGPDAIRRAVALAREAGLRTTVHVETAADLALALDAGADEAAHLPGYNWALGLGADDYRIPDDLARRLADRRFVVVTTTVVTVAQPPADAAAADRRAQVRALQAENIKRLHAAGVPLAIGTDSYALTALDEARNLRSLGALADAEILRLWIDTAPTSIFPDRAIGRLAPGFEASFLGLEADPFADLERLAAPKLRVKQGVTLD